MPQHFKMMAVMMRFGSLKDFKSRYLKYKDISQALNVKESTLRMMIKKFKDHNYQFPKPQYQKNTKLNQEAINYVIDQDTLAKWGPLSLKDTLRKYYLQAGIKHSKAQYIRHSKYLRREEIETKKKEFVQQLVLSMIQERQIYFVDQTTFHAWQQKSKTWQYPFQKIEFQQCDSRGEGFTVYGAIDILNNEFYYSQSKSTSIECFQKFIEHIKNKKGNLIDAIFVLDNHSSHKSIVIKTQLEEEGVEILYLPPYSSELNPIEKLWNVIKGIFKKQLMISEDIDKVSSVKNIVNNICLTMSKYDFKKFLFSNYGLYKEILIK